MLELFYGGPVSGNQRFARPALEADMMRKMSETNGLSLFGLRRIGKSTLRLHAQETLARTEGHTVVFVDAQGINSIDQFLFAILRGIPKESIPGKMLDLLSGNPALPETLRNALKGLVSKGTETQDLISGYWPLISSEIADALARDRSPKTLIVDEFSFLIRNMAQAEPATAAARVNALLASMRQWRENGLRMLLTGSIGLTGLVRQYKFDREHLNDLQAFTVPELTEEEARAFVTQATHEPSNGSWTAEHTSAFLSACGAFYPCFLVKGLQALDRAAPPPPDTLEALFRRQVRADLHDLFINQFDKTLGRYRETDRAHADSVLLPILRAVLDTPDGRPEPVLEPSPPYDTVDIRTALTMLREDGFLDRDMGANDDRVWRPASRLTTLWWKQSNLGARG
ncbi:hypothetical protein [Pararhodospirillum oryzae]|uniref:Uncharacterized protein n=1 Tax=Pararhodospirillum oryzae TaxID=478448 RepID=A0A512H5W9_9PROT|nr:hypothetical protein [Pararhodospirillum oryzae]GEO80828.1 hypothetical protein ROR02_09590 [Pararhodospirillum oryzae]